MLQPGHNLVEQVRLVLPTGCTSTVPAIELTTRNCHGLTQKLFARKIKENYLALTPMENNNSFTNT